MIRAGGRDVDLTGPLGAPVLRPRRRRRADLSGRLHDRHHWRSEVDDAVRRRGRGGHVRRVEIAIRRLDAVQAERGVSGQRLELRRRLKAVVDDVEEEVAAECGAYGDRVGDADDELSGSADRAWQPGVGELGRLRVVATDANRIRIECAGHAQCRELRTEVDWEEERAVRAGVCDGRGHRQGVVPAGERIRRQAVHRRAGGECGDGEPVGVADSEVGGNAVIRRADVAHGLGDRDSGIRPVRRFVGADGETQRSESRDGRHTEVLRFGGAGIGMGEGD